MSSVATSLGSIPRHHEAALAVNAAFTELEDGLRWVEHTPLEMNAESCLVQICSEDLGRLAMTIAPIALIAPVTVIEPTELADTIRQLATHLTVSPP